MTRHTRPILTILAALALSTPLMAQEPPRMVLFEDPALSGNRLHYPLLIADGRGYRISCPTQAEEEAVIRGLGFTAVPSEILTGVDPAIIAAQPNDNPVLCPTAPDYVIKDYATEGATGVLHHLHFPTERGATTYGDRLYVPECLGLTNALGLDLTAALPADPTPFFAGKIHKIGCVAGDLIQPTPTSFAAWCRKSDRTAAQTATVLAMLDATPGGISALGDSAACNAADTFLRSITTLDLSGKDVQSLEPLTHLPQLTTLMLARNNITDLRPLPKLTALGHLDLSGNGLTSVAALAPLTALTRLDLSDNMITDIRALAALPLLTSLLLDRNQIADVAPLRFLVALTRLTLSGNGLTGDKVEPLTALGNLTFLDLSDNQIADFALLGSFPSTVDINLAGNPIMDRDRQSFLDLCVLERDAATPFGQTIRAVIEVMGGGTCQAVSDAVRATTSLDLSGKILMDISPLATLPHLTRLNLSGNAIADLGPLAGLTQLVDLQLADNDITDIRPVGALVRLQDFDASGNPVALTDFLSACLMRHHKQTANPELPLLSDDQMAEITALLAGSGQVNCGPATQELTQLHTADFGASGLRTLTYFGVLGNVRSLALPDNQLADVTGLMALPRLTQVNLDGNQIDSIGDVMGLPRLERLSLARNPLRGLHGIATLSQLRSLDISQTDVRMIAPLAALTNLETVRMRDLSLVYENMRDFCFVHRFDPIALGTSRAFMEAVAALAAGSGVDPADCTGVEIWANDRTSLNLNKKNIVTLDPVRFFPKLEELYLFDNLITDLRPLSGLQNLKTLNVSTNRISDLPALPASLVIFTFANNMVTDLSPLGSLRFLASVEGENNRVERMTPLTFHASATWIDLRNNRMTVFPLSAPEVVLLPHALLGGNPICANGGFIHPALQAACVRVPRLIFDHILVRPDDVVLGQFNERLACQITNTCDSINRIILNPGIGRINR